MLGFQFFLSLSFAVISHDNINTIVAKEVWLPALIRAAEKQISWNFPDCNLKLCIIYEHNKNTVDKIYFQNNG